MSQLNDMLERVATIQKGITITLPADITSGSAITDTYPYLPADVSQANVPFFINEYYGGPSTLAAVTGQQQIRNRLDMVFCAVRSEAERNQQDTVRILSLWRDAILAAFAGKVRLGNDPLMYMVVEAVVTNVGGFENVEIGTTQFRGMTFTLTIQEWYPTTITA